MIDTPWEIAGCDAEKIAKVLETIKEQSCKDSLHRSRPEQSRPDRNKGSEEMMITGIALAGSQAEYDDSLKKTTAFRIGLGAVIAMLKQFQLTAATIRFASGAGGPFLDESISFGTAIATVETAIKEPTVPIFVDRGASPAVTEKANKLFRAVVTALLVE